MILFPTRAQLRMMAALFMWGAVAAAGVAAQPQPAVASAPDAAFAQAEANSLLVQAGLGHSHRFLQAWLGAAEPTTGLIPRNLTDSPFWNGKDSAADNYPFMVLTAWFTDRAALEGPLRRMLASEQALTKQPGWLRLTDDYLLTGTPALRFAQPEAERIFFNSSEYVKDGLLALTEWLGPSPWSARMFELLDDSFALAACPTPSGPIPLDGSDRAIEVSGDYLQALARAYWISGRDPKYLRWGIRLADTYLLPDRGHHPTRDLATLRLRDHGCEIVGGLAEFYASLHHAGRLPDGAEWAAKKAAYEPQIHAMLDRILAVGRNTDGLFYNAINPQTGAVIDARLSDSWGYVLNAYYTVFLVDGTAAYREAARRPLGVLDARYRHYNWEPNYNWKPTAENPDAGNQDGYADAIESALNLYNRFQADETAGPVTAWLDREIRELWSRQQPDGFIEKWHGDGNFARTSIMYCLWKSQGASLQPWRADVRVGAVRAGDTLKLVIAADQPWSGTLHFDYPRHREALHLPADWPRINQFPEWFTVQAGASYKLHGLPGHVPAKWTAEQLRAGVPVEINTGETLRLILEP